MATLTLACLLLLTVSAEPAQRRRTEARLRQTAAGSAAQSGRNDEPLKPGSTVAGELGNGERRQYRITLAANQYAELSFEPGAFLCASVFQPDGKALIERCHASSAWSLKLFAATPGDYLLVLSQQYPSYAIQYRVRLSELKTRGPIEYQAANSAAFARSKPDETGDLAAQTARAPSRPGPTLNSYATGELTAESARELIGKHEQALAAVRPSANKSGTARLLNNLGRLYVDTSEYQRSLDRYGEALTLWRSAGDKAGEADTLNDLGVVYDLLGDRQQALAAYRQALALRQSLGDRAGTAATLNNIGLIHNALGDYQQALDFYRQALPLWRGAGDRAGEATTLNNTGLAYSGLGEHRQALSHFQQALPIWRALSNRRGTATTQNNIALTYTSLGEVEQAVRLYKEVRGAKAMLGEPSREANTLFGYARAERDRGDLLTARGLIVEAIEIAESLRGRIVSRELRNSYFASNQGYYEFYIDLLMRLHRQSPKDGHDAAALAANERARARGLLEILTEAGADIREGVDPALLERERSLRRSLDSTAERQSRLIATNLKDQQASDFERELYDLQKEYDEVQTRIRQTSPRYAALTQPEPLTASRLQSDVLDADTLLLEYSLGTERSYLWAVTKDSLTGYELPARAGIEEQARQVYALLSRPDAWAGSQGSGQRSLGDTLSKARPATEAIMNLSRTLLGPVAGQLGRKRLVIIADGALQYIPFAALSEPAGDDRTYKPLVLEHEVVSLPSASTLSVLRRELKGRKPAPKQLAVLADPVFGREDERVKEKAAPAGATPAQAEAQRGLTREVAAAARESGAADAAFQLPRLPGTRYEAEQILKLVPAAERSAALDFAASRAGATDPGLSQYRYVHFATHGLLNSQHPELSGLVLTLYDEQGRPQDGFLRAHEIYNLRLPAEMVVLSACQTGLGKVIRGEGLVGLTRGFMYAGAPRVVVSLWNVSDAATAELMTRFYRGMLVDKLRPAQALQAAQVSLLKEKQYSLPYYWAAFTLQGEWR